MADLLIKVGRLIDGTEAPDAVPEGVRAGLLSRGRQLSRRRGRYFGSWRGPLSVDGDHVLNAADPEVIARYTQFRDCLVRVEDPIGGGIGWGNCQTYVYGAWPQYGLDGSEPAF